MRVQNCIEPSWQPFLTTLLPNFDGIYPQNEWEWVENEWKTSLLLNWAPWSLLGVCQCAWSIYSALYGICSLCPPPPPKVRGGGILDSLCPSVRLSFRKCNCPRRTVSQLGVSAWEFYMPKPMVPIFLILMAAKSSMVISCRILHARVIFSHCQHIFIVT